MNKNDYLAQIISRRNSYMQGLDISQITDKPRNRHYDEMIKSAVKDKVCADVGFGSGILTMMALKHGAKHVYAYEMHPSTYDFGKAIVEDIRASEYFRRYRRPAENVTFINERFTGKEKVDIVIHEILMRSVWGEGLYEVYKLVDKKAHILPGKMTVKILCCEDQDYTYFCNGDDAMHLDLGVDYLKPFHDTWYDLNSSEEYFSAWPAIGRTGEQLKNTIHKIEDHFTRQIGEYVVDLNNDDIPEIIEVEVDVPKNSIVTIRAWANDFQIVRADGYCNWYPEKIICVSEGGRKTFHHRTSDGAWYF